MNESDFAILDEAQKRIGLTSRTETLRFLLRRWADENGLDLPGTGKPKRRPAKKRKRK